MINDFKSQKMDFKVNALSSNFEINFASLYFYKIRGYIQIDIKTKAFGKMSH